MTVASDPFVRLRAAEFAGLSSAAYLNAASLGPLPERSRRAMELYNQRRAKVHEMEGSDFYGPPDSFRQNAARLLSADAAEIAFASSTSAGINLAALGLEVPSGSRVLVSDREFPANVYPWMHRDRFEVDVLSTRPDGWPDEDALEERIRAGNVSIVAVSSVQFDNGFRADLPRIGAACREAGAYFVVDAIQSLGVLPFDVEAVKADVVATGGHKWLVGPLGVGFVYVRREVQERLKPPYVGWSSMRSAADLQSVIDYQWGFFPDARRYEVGTIPLHDLAGLSASMSLLLEADPKAIGDYVDQILEPLRAWLLSRPEVGIRTSFEEGRRSGIVSFAPPSIEKSHRALQRAGVYCSVREGAIRVAAHFYNSSEDIARLLEVLDKQAKTGWG
mgnify:CR=1 FL=1